MKLWQKISLSAAAGILIGIFLPSNGGDTLSFLKSFSDILIAFGTYALVPMVFAQVIGASYELRQDKTGLRFFIRTVLFLVGSAFLLSLLGGLCVLLLSPERIPIVIEEATVPELPSLAKLLQVIFPGNALQTLSSPSMLLVSVFVFALILGLAMFAQRANSRPLLDLSDSLSKVFYQINRFVVEILVWGAIILSTTRVVMIRETQDLELFVQLIVLIGILSLLIVFVVYPLVIFLYDRRHKPFGWIRQLVPALITGLFSGNALLPLGFLTRAGSEELGLQRRIWQWFYPLAVVAGRAGTAMISTIAFILILRSYSSLEISILQFAGVVFSSMIISFILGSVPGAGVLVSLSLMSSWYGQGLEEGFLILQPASPILVSCAVFVDVSTQAFIAYMLDLMASRDNTEEKRPSRFRDEFTLN